MPQNSQIEELTTPLQLTEDQKTKTRLDESDLCDPPITTAMSWQVVVTLHPARRESAPGGKLTVRRHEALWTGAASTTSSSLAMHFARAPADASGAAWAHAACPAHTTRPPPGRNRSPQPGKAGPFGHPMQGRLEPKHNISIPLKRSPNPQKRKRSTRARATRRELHDTLRAASVGPMHLATCWNRSPSQRTGRQIRYSQGAPDPCAGAAAGYIGHAAGTSALRSAKAKTSMNHAATASARGLREASSI